MIGVTVTFDYSGDFDRERARDLRWPQAPAGCLRACQASGSRSLPWIRSAQAGSELLRLGL